MSLWAVNVPCVCLAVGQWSHSSGSVSCLLPPHPTTTQANGGVRASSFLRPFVGSSVQLRSHLCPRFWVLWLDSCSLEPPSKYVIPALQIGKDPWFPYLLPVGQAPRASSSVLPTPCPVAPSSTHFKAQNWQLLITCSPPPLSLVKCH